jgi:hypothetical protein
MTYLELYTEKLLPELSLEQLEWQRMSFEKNYGHPEDVKILRAIKDRIYALTPVKEKQLQCPVCESYRVDLYFIDDNCQPTDDKGNILNHQCRCGSCGYDAERCAFDDGMKPGLFEQLKEILN